MPMYIFDLFLSFELPRALDATQLEQNCLIPEVVQPIAAHCTQ